MSRPSFGELDGQDPYDILELPPTASEADIRAARKRLLRRYHPDMPSGDLRRTQLITAAADLLLDPPRRSGYYDLRDEQSRWTVFATADAADAHAADAADAHAADAYADAPDADADAADAADAADDRYRFAGPRPRIRPTFVTPPAEPSHRTDPFEAASAFAAEGYFAWADSFAPTSAPAWDAPASAQPQPGDAGPQPERTEPRPGRGARRADDHRAAARWNALAIASVVAILTWTPIPLVLGLLALRQIRRHDQRGARLAVTGIVAGGVLVLIYLYVLISSGF